MKQVGYLKFSFDQTSSYIPCTNSELPFFCCFIFGELLWGDNLTVSSTKTVFGIGSKEGGSPIGIGSGSLVEVLPDSSGAAPAGTLSIYKPLTDLV